MTVDAVTAEPADARPEPEGAPPNGSPAGIVRGVSYAGCFVVAFLLVLLYIRPWAEPGFDVFPEGWDLTWMQMTFVVNGQVGPFGVTDHLAFPDGYSTWSYPQLGLGAAVFAMRGDDGAFEIWRLRREHVQRYAVLAHRHDAARMQYIGAAAGDFLGFVVLQ